MFGRTRVNFALALTKWTIIAARDPVAAVQRTFNLPTRRNPDRRRTFRAVSQPAVYGQSLLFRRRAYLIKGMPLQRVQGNVTPTIALPLSAQEIHRLFAVHFQCEQKIKSILLNF